MRKQIGILVLVAAKVVVAAPPCNPHETARAISQSSKILTLETGDYVYQWRLNGSPDLVFVINDTFMFCQKGSSFFVKDADGKLRRFSIVKATKRSPQPPNEYPPPRGFAANLEQGPPSFHAAQLDKQWKTWMSTSGPEHYLVRFDGEHVYVEQVIGGGAWLKIDSSISGKVYTGTVEYGFANPAGGKPCPLTGPAEFTRVDSSRIEGAMTVLPPTAVISADCTFLGPGPRIKRFIWIPE